MKKTLKKYLEMEKLKPETIILNPDCEVVLIDGLIEFGINFNMELTAGRLDLWKKNPSIQRLPIAALKRGFEKCLAECDFFPNIATFIEKCQTSQSGWDTMPDEVFQIEYKKEIVPMPAEFRETFAAFLEKH